MTDGDALIRAVKELVKQLPPAEQERQRRDIVIDPIGGQRGKPANRLMADGLEDRLTAEEPGDWFGRRKR